MWITVRTGDDAGREIALDAEHPLVLGRERGCDVILRDPRASRRHAEIRRLANGHALLRDLGSANGTWVGGERVAEAILHGGEELRLGDVRLCMATAHAAAVPSGPTFSMVGRMVEKRARRASRFAGIAASLAAVAVAGAAVLLMGGPGAEADAKDPVPGVVASVAPSTVLVESLRGGSRTGTGSGWVLDAGAGLVVTNAHVLNQGDRVRIAAQGRRRDATVLGVAPCEDVALLRVADATGLRSARLGRGAGVRQGETVVALGYPAGAGPKDEPTSTTGVVSVARTSYRDPAPDVPGYAEAVQTDSALNPGNSGGPLADLDGRIVGMNAAVRSESDDGRALQNQNYAIAVDRVRAVVAQLRRGVSPAWSGLTFAYPTPAQLADRRLPAGLLVTGAIAGSPAARAGLSPAAGLLVGVDGRAVGTTLSSYCAAAGDATPAELTFARPGVDRLDRVALRP